MYEVKREEPRRCERAQTTNRHAFDGGQRNHLEQQRTQPSSTRRIRSHGRFLVTLLAVLVARVVRQVGREAAQSSFGARRQLVKQHP